MNKQMIESIGYGSLSYYSKRLEIIGQVVKQSIDAYSTTIEWTVIKGGEVIDVKQRDFNHRDSSEQYEMAKLYLTELKNLHID